MKLVRSILLTMTLSCLVVATPVYYQNDSFIPQFSGYSHDKLVDMRRLNLIEGAKRGFSYFVKGLAVYAVTYGAIRATARSTNSRVLTRIADWMYGLGVCFGLILGTIIRQVISLDRFVIFILAAIVTEGMTYNFNYI